MSSDNHNGDGDGVESDANKLCFVIGPIGPDDSDIRKHADQLFKHIISTAATDAGIQRVERADHIESSGIITAEIVSRLDAADIVVADLSDANPNVYYELAIRHLLRRPFVHMIREGESIPFDVGAQRTIRFDLSDLDSAAEARTVLTHTIQAELGKEPAAVETPFTVAMDLKALTSVRGSDGAPELQELNRTVLRMNRELGLVRRELNSARRGQLPSGSDEYGRTREPSRVMSARQYEEMSASRRKLEIERRHLLELERRGVRERLSGDPAIIDDPSLREQLEVQEGSLSAEIEEFSRSIHDVRRKGEMPE